MQDVFKVDVTNVRIIMDYEFRHQKLSGPIVKTTTK